MSRLAQLFRQSNAHLIGLGAKRRAVDELLQRRPVVQRFVLPVLAEGDEYYGVKRLDQFRVKDQRAYKDYQYATRLQTRVEISTDPLRDLGHSQGDVKLQQIRWWLNHLGTWTRSPDQVMFHDNFLIACLPHIYGKDWDANGARVMAEMDLKRIDYEVLVQTPRRFGKTIAVAMFVAVVALVCKGIKLSIFSTGSRASKSMVDWVLKFAAYLPKGLERIIKQSKEELMFSAEPLGANGGPGSHKAKAAETAEDTTVIKSYPASVDSKYQKHKSTTGKREREIYLLCCICENTGFLGKLTAEMARYAQFVKDSDAQYALEVQFYDWKNASKSQSNKVSDALNIIMAVNVLVKEKEADGLFTEAMEDMFRELDDVLKPLSDAIILAKTTILEKPDVFLCNHWNSLTATAQFQQIMVAAGMIIERIKDYDGASAEMDQASTSAPPPKRRLSADVIDLLDSDDEKEKKKHRRTNVNSPVRDLGFITVAQMFAEKDPEMLQDIEDDRNDRERELFESQPPALEPEERSPAAEVKSPVVESKSPVTAEEKEVKSKKKTLFKTPNFFDQEEKKAEKSEADEASFNLPALFYTPNPDGLLQNLGYYSDEDELNQEVTKDELVNDVNVQIRWRNMFNFKGNDNAFPGVSTDRLKRELSWTAGGLAGMPPKRSKVTLQRLDFLVRSLPPLYQFNTVLRQANINNLPVCASWLKNATIAAVNHQQVRSALSAEFKKPEDNIASEMYAELIEVVKALEMCQLWISEVPKLVEGMTKCIRSLVATVLAGKGTTEALNNQIDALREQYRALHLYEAYTLWSVGDELKPKMDEQSEEDAAQLNLLQPDFGDEKLAALVARQESEPVSKDRLAQHTQHQREIAAFDQWSNENTKVILDDIKRLWNEAEIKDPQPDKEVWEQVYPFDVSVQSYQYRELGYPMQRLWIQPQADYMRSGMAKYMSRLDKRYARLHNDNLTSQIKTAINLLSGSERVLIFSRATYGYWREVYGRLMFLDEIVWRGIRQKAKSMAAISSYYDIGFLVQTIEREMKHLELFRQFNTRVTNQENEINEIDQGLDTSIEVADWLERMQFANAEIDLVYRRVALIELPLLQRFMKLEEQQPKTEEGVGVNFAQQLENEIRRATQRHASEGQGNTGVLSEALFVMIEKFQDFNYADAVTIIWKILDSAVVMIGEIREQAEFNQKLLSGYDDLDKLFRAANSDAVRLIEPNAQLARSVISGWTQLIEKKNHDLAEDIENTFLNNKAAEDVQQFELKSIVEQFQQLEENISLYNEHVKNRFEKIFEKTDSKKIIKYLEGKNAPVNYMAIEALDDPPRAAIRKFLQKGEARQAQIVKSENKSELAEDLKVEQKAPMDPAVKDLRRLAFKNVNEHIVLVHYVELLPKMYKNNAWYKEAKSWLVDAINIYPFASPAWIEAFAAHEFEKIIAEYNLTVFKSTDLSVLNPYLMKTDALVAKIAQAIVVHLAGVKRVIGTAQTLFYATEKKMLQESKTTVYRGENVEDPADVKFNEAKKTFETTKLKLQEIQNVLLNFQARLNYASENIQHYKTYLAARGQHVSWKDVFELLIGRTQDRQTAHEELLRKLAGKRKKTITKAQLGDVEDDDEPDLIFDMPEFDPEDFDVMEIEKPETWHMDDEIEFVGMKQEPNLQSLVQIKPDPDIKQPEPAVAAPMEIVVKKEKVVAMPTEAQWDQLIEWAKPGIAMMFGWNATGDVNVFMLGLIRGQMDTGARKSEKQKHWLKAHGYCG